MEGIRRALVLDLVFIAGTAIEQTTSVGPHNYRIVVSTHSIDPYLWGESNNPLLVHEPAYLSICPAAPALQRGLSTNPGVTVWWYVGAVEEMVCVVCVGVA